MEKKINKCQNEMTEMLELSEKYFKATIIKIIQWAIMNMFEKNEKVLNLSN